MIHNANEYPAHVPFIYWLKWVVTWRNKYEIVERYTTIWSDELNIIGGHYNRISLGPNPTPFKDLN